MTLPSYGDYKHMFRDGDVGIELQFGDNRIVAHGPQGFVEGTVREFLFSIGKAASGSSSDGDSSGLVKHPAQLRELYQHHGSTKQWENVVLFVHYYQTSEGKDAVTYHDIRSAYKALAIKAPNIQASANSLKFNLKLLYKVQRGSVALTVAGEKHVKALLDGEKPKPPVVKAKAVNPKTTKKKRTTKAKAKSKTKRKTRGAKARK